MRKLEEKELESLQLSVRNINNIQMQIGGMEAQKHELLHAITEASQKFQLEQAELEKKYGKVDIDISTGEIKDRDGSTEKN